MIYFLDLFWLREGPIHHVGMVGVICLHHQVQRHLLQNFLLR
jgi:hypothetical protein